ncbi:hypothetical protein ABW19_dt0202349 [Dactylella cylindrospora]|nr:hypothetical protein ABW19_dt0202349 [Dactylella cylindrospora]
MGIRESNFDIDDYINPWIPPSPLHHLPPFASRFLGYRAAPHKPIGNLLTAWWSFFGAFCGIAAFSAVVKYTGVFSNVDAPFVIGSFGASAILEYGAIGSPLGQPRNCVLGHFTSALTGICIAKLFKYSDDFEQIKWLAGALAVGTASAVMSFTNTSHPPGGATALLAAVDPSVEGMGWWLLPYVLLGTVVLLVVALAVNNIQRQFPIYWWTPKDTGGKLWPVVKATQPDLEALEEQKTRDEDSDSPTLRLGNSTEDLARVG